MKCEKIILKAEDLPTVKERRTMSNFGFAGSPVTRVIPPAKGRGAKYNRAKAKRRVRELLKADYY